MARRKTKSGSASKADREFVSEAEEILDAMRDCIADLNDQRDENNDLDPDIVNRLFRAAHSLKALAGMFCFEPIQDLAHRLEDILDSLRLGRVSRTDSLMELIDDSVRLFASLLGQVGDDEAMESSGELIAALVARIDEETQQPAQVSQEFGDLDVEPSLLRALTEYEEHRLRENLKRGRCIALVNTAFEIISFEDGLSALSDAIRRIGELLSTLPAPGDAPDSQINFSLLVATEYPSHALAEQIDFSVDSIHAVYDASETVKPAKKSKKFKASKKSEKAEPEKDSGASSVGEVMRAESEGEQAPSDSETSEPVAKSGSSEFESLKSISDTVRVDIRKLDELMNLVGELVIQRGSIGDLISKLRGGSNVARIGVEFSKVHKILDRKIREIQSAVLEVRMVPLRQVFEKVSRVVRKLRRDLDKEVRLEVRGADTELDKLIVEALVDPLMHVVRNSLDHAIEPREERVALGKDPTGRVGIDAFQRGSHVVIAVTDDGRGVDPVKLRARAESIGIVSPGDTLSDKDALDLIFVPGISTRDEVTETSGRGVGMDVVRSNLASFGGVVSVESVLGRGTTISMILPITLAIIQSLIVRVLDQRFAIPLNAVLETLLIDESEIQRSEGKELLNLRGDAIRLHRIAQEFDLADESERDKSYVIVIGMGDQRVGLLVDQLEGQQDTVVKPIQGPVQSVRGITGATDLGDDSPVLVLDVAALIEDAAHKRGAA